MPDRPNVVYFQVDNLGYGELGCYGGGVLRGAPTRRIDQFALEGTQLLNFAPEAQCTPSRAALLTGRHAIRTGNHTVALAGEESGIVAWERTLGDMFSAAGYATIEVWRSCGGGHVSTVLMIARPANRATIDASTDPAT
jgi:arylsulfatase